MKPLKEHPITYQVAYKVFEILERNTIQVKFVKDLQMDVFIHDYRTAKPTLCAIVPRITTGKIFWALHVLHNNYDPSC